MSDTEGVGLTCYLPGDNVLICEDCNLRTQHSSESASQVAWSIHVLEEHWEQAGFTEESRDVLLKQLTEAMR